MADFRLGRIKFKWQGDWTAETEYVKDDVVNYDGSSWVCVVNHTANETSFLNDRATKWEEMISGVAYKGEWNSSNTYQKKNIVTYNGSAWICKLNDVTNQTPSTSSSIYWDLFAQGAAELTTLGDLLYRDSLANNRLPIGSNNATLQVSSSGIPEWVTNVDIPGNLTVTGTSQFTGNITATNDLAVNGGDVTSTATVFNLLNATVTTLNIGGAASVNIGSAVGITTLGNDLDVNGTVYQGINPIAQETTDGLTDAVAVLIGNVDAFSQVAHKNINDGTGASTDFIAYADNGDNDSGWIDMGITSSAFDDPTYGVTGINDGYIFMSAPVGTTGNGNLYISTSGDGVQNDIVFSTGGFEDNTYERMRIVGVAHGSYNAGINLVDDLSTTNGNFYIGPNAKDLTVDGITASTQLDGGINSTATTITVDSTTGFNTKGYITIGDEVIYYGGKTATTFTNCNRGYQGTTADSHLDNAVVEQITYVGLTNATAVFTGNEDDFVQFAIKNTNSGTSASTDLIAYASDGDNDSGWIDLGITSSTYSDPAFTVTGPGTGYLFFSAPATTTGTGDLLIGTDHTGSNNDIVFFTNGFDAGNERLRIVGQGANAGVEVYADTESTSTTTGALRVDGGIGLQGNLYVGGDVNIVGNITLGGSGNTVETESLAVADPIIRMANGNTASDALDIGFVGTYATTGPATRYTGLVRDASDGTYKLFTEMTANPTTTVDFTGATYADLRLNNLDFTTAGKIKINGSAGTDGKFLKTTAGGMEWADAAVTVSDSTTNSSFYPLFTTATSGTVTSASVSSTRFSFNPSTGALAVKGSLALQGSTSGAVTFQVPATAGSATYTLPSADGSSGYALVTNGSGTLSWAAAGATITTTTTNATFYPVFASSSSGSLTTANVNTGFTYNASSGLLTVTSLTESSSIALKENVTPITDALTAITKLVGVTYDRRDGSKQNEAGLIAEAVDQVLPNLVTKDENGNPDGVHYTKLTAYLIEAVKTLTARIEQLEGKN